MPRYAKSASNDVEKAMESARRELSTANSTDGVRFERPDQTLSSRFGPARLFREVQATAGSSTRKTLALRYTPSGGAAVPPSVEK
jgi:hypothetical protein